MRRTNLEPTPTAYVLFAEPRLDAPVAEITEETLARLNNLRLEHLARMYNYCLVHYQNFEDVGTAYESDPFANLLAFYWPIDTNETAVEEALAKGLEEGCGFLTKHYDYGRATEILSELDEGAYSHDRGPVMVLDFGFDALAAPFGDLKDEDLGLIPANWELTMTRTLQEVQASRFADLRELSKISEEISALVETVSKIRKKKNRKPLEDEIELKRKKRGGILKRWFSRGSWGRAFICGFSETVVRAAGDVIPVTEPLEAKLKTCCGPAAKETARAET